MPSHFQHLERMYLAAPIHRHTITGVSIDIREAQCQITCPVGEKYHHAAGGMYGAIFFKMLDDAAYFAAASTEREFFLVTAHFELDFYRPFAHGLIKSVGKIDEITNDGIIASASLFNEQGKILASGSGRFVRARTRLCDVAAYG
jgi:uncharacterized protein (TIGR00369 family)